jgi:hypothetical protein
MGEQEKRGIDDAVEFLHHRYIGDDPERKASLEAERALADAEQRAYDAAGAGALYVAKHEEIEAWRWEGSLEGAPAWVIPAIQAWPERDSLREDVEAGDLILIVRSGEPCDDVTLTATGYVSREAGGRLRGWYCDDFEARYKPKPEGMRGEAVKPPQSWQWEGHYTGAPQWVIELRDRFPKGPCIRSPDSDATVLHFYGAFRDPEQPSVATLQMGDWLTWEGGTKVRVGPADEAPGAEANWPAERDAAWALYDSPRDQFEQAGARFTAMRWDMGNGMQRAWRAWIEANGLGPVVKFIGLGHRPLWRPDTNSEWRDVKFGRWIAVDLETMSASMWDDETFRRRVRPVFDGQFNAVAEMFEQAAEDLVGEVADDVLSRLPREQGTPADAVAADVASSRNEGEQDVVSSNLGGELVRILRFAAMDLEGRLTVASNLDGAPTQRPSLPQVKGVLERVLAAREHVSDSLPYVQAGAKAHPPAEADGPLAQRVQILHGEAMLLADDGAAAQRKGDREAARVAYHAAMTKEAEAARICNCAGAEPSRSVLYRSAANLALECGEHREAERLAAEGLAGTPPEQIAEELRSVLERAQAEIVPPRERVPHWEWTWTGDNLDSAPADIRKALKEPFPEKSSCAMVGGDLTVYMRRLAEPIQTVHPGDTIVLCPESGILLRRGGGSV